MRTNAMHTIDHIACATRVFSIEADAISSLAERIDDNFSLAVEQVLKSSGRVIVCGMGKSGIIGKKIAATLASTGTPSFFMHPGEAFHGDLGMVTPEDIFIAISYSGETDELLKLLPFLRESGNFLIAITGSTTSSLGKAAHCRLNVCVHQEACHLHLAPTSSTTATLAMGDALAIALMAARDFKPESFARFHPGGSLGRRLLSRVEHEMTSDPLPIIDKNSHLMDVISAITKSSLGLVVVTNDNDYSIITDGDIRRGIEKYGERLFNQRASDIMSINPIGVPMGTRVEDALALMDRMHISSLLVLDDREKLVGIFKK